MAVTCWEYVLGVTDSFVVPKTWLMLNVLGAIIGSFIIVAIKPVEDCFACFNRLGHKRTYSMFQYPIEQSATQD